MRIKNVAGIVALTLTCLLAAGCGGGPPPPAEFGLGSSASDWQTGFDEGAAGRPIPVGSDNSAYQDGYQAGAAYKDHPTGPRPANPYGTVPARYQTPSASGGG